MIRGPTVAAKQMHCIRHSFKSAPPMTAAIAKQSVLLFIAKTAAVPNITITRPKSVVILVPKTR